MLNSGVLHVFWNLYHEFHPDLAEKRNETRHFLLVCHFLDWYWCFFSRSNFGLTPKHHPWNAPRSWKIQVYYFMVVQGCQPPTQEIRPHLRIMVMNHPRIRPAYFFWGGGVNVAFGKYPQSHDCSTPKKWKIQERGQAMIYMLVENKLLLCFKVKNEGWQTFS